MAEKDDLELEIEIEADEPDETVEVKTKETPDEPEKSDSPDEALAELAAQRDALETRASRAERTVQQVERDSQRKIAETNLGAFNNALSAAEAEIQQFKRSWKEAQEAGEYDKAADAQEKLAEKVAERRDLTRGRDQIDQWLKTPQAEIPDDPTEGLIARAQQSGRPFSAKAQDWFRSHPDVATDDELLLKVQWADTAARKRGHKLDSEDYYNFVNDAMGFGAKESAKEAEPVVEIEADKPKPKPRKIIAAPPSRDVAVSNGNLSGSVVKLTRGEASAATDGTHVWNDYHLKSGRIKDPTLVGKPIGVQEFARRKKTLMQQGAYDRLTVQQ